MDINEAIADAAEKAEQRRLGDPSLNEIRVMSLIVAVECFASGALRATPALAEGSFVLPISFESVVNWISDFLSRRYRASRLVLGDVFLFEASINELVGVMQEAAGEHPAFRRWNDPPGSRPFIDLDAVWQNIVVRFREHFKIQPEITKPS